MQAIVTGLIVILACLAVAQRYLPRSLLRWPIVGSRLGASRVTVRAIPIVLDSAPALAGCAAACPACNGCGNPARD